jgi:uncharacterized protein (UPF0332 family)
MNYQEFINKGLIKEENIGFDQISKLLERSFRNIKSAKTLVKDDDKEGAFRFAYEAMLLAGRSLVFSYSFRPRSIGSHKIVIDFVSESLGKEYKILVQKFDRMRRKRNYLIYGVGLAISDSEAQNAINDAKEFLEIIEKIVKNKNKQKELL